MWRPFLLRSGYNYTISNTYDGDFEATNFASSEMRKWIGGIRNKEGHSFNKRVKQEFVKFGWNANSDIELSGLLMQKMEKDYGDIDVVAWNKKTGKVMLIECKDLFLAKTAGEIARQIYDFRGVKTNKGKPDRLLKHIYRYERVRKSLSILKKNLAVEVDVELEVCVLFNSVSPLRYLDDERMQGVKVLSFNEISQL